MSSQWHKTKALTGRQPNTKRKKNRFAFFFPYLLFFTFYFILVILLYFFSFISTLRTMLYFKCGGIGRMLVFLFWFSLLFQKKTKKQISMFDLLNSYWFMRMWALHMRINWDRWRYKSNEGVCMQVLRFNGLGIDFENMPCWLYSVIPMQAFEPSTLYYLIVHSLNDMYL